jgi:hypothetical protein
LKGVRGIEIYGIFMAICTLFFLALSSQLLTNELAGSGNVMNFLSSLILAHIVLLICLLSAFIWGNWLLSIFEVQMNKLSHIIVAIALGFAVLSLQFFALAYLHLYQTMYLYALMLLPIALSYKNSLAVLKSVFISPAKPFSIQPAALLAFVAALITIALSTIALDRPMPFGFDELSLYMNIPHLLAGYKGLVSGNATYSWALFMGLGFANDDNVFQASLFSVLPGILCWPALFAIAKRYLDNGWSLIASALFMMMPTVIWHNSADAKVDLALSFIVFALFILVLAYGERKEANPFTPSEFLKKISANIKWQQVWNVAILAGIIAGLAFSIKFTALFFIFAFVAAFAFRVTGSGWAGLSAVSLSASVALFGGFLRYSGLEANQAEKPYALALICLIIGVVCIGLVARKQFKTVLTFAAASAVFIAVWGMVFSPWMLKNYGETKSLGSQDLLNGKSSLVPFDTLLKHVEPQAYLMMHQANLTADAANTPVKTDNPANRTGKFEEVHRYFGYEPGLPRYLSIFRDLTDNNNVNIIAANVSLFFLLLFPLSVLAKDEKQWWQNILRIGAIVFILLISILAESYIYPDWAAHLKQVNPKMVSIVHAVYMPMQGAVLSIANVLKPFYDLLGGNLKNFIFIFLVLSTILLVILFFPIMKQRSKAEKSLWMLSLASLMFWWWLGSGITWYGLPILGILPIFVFAGFKSWSGLLDDTVMKYVIAGGVALCFLLLTVQRNSALVPSYQFETSVNKIIMQYASGSIDKEAGVRSVNSAIFDAATELNAHPEAKVLRCGTYMNYFINNNDTRVYEDNQMDLFNAVSERYKDNLAIDSTLKKLGIEYVLYDLNTGSIDNTPGKTLTKKIQRFYQFLSNNPKLGLVVTDRMVEDPNSKDVRIIDGKETHVAMSIYGIRMINPGSLVLLKLL